MDQLFNSIQQYFSRTNQAKLWHKVSRHGDMDSIFPKITNQIAQCIKHMNSLGEKIFRLKWWRMSMQPYLQIWTALFRYNIAHCLIYLTCLAWYFHICRWSSVSSLKPLDAVSAQSPWPWFSVYLPMCRLTLRSRQRRRPIVAEVPYGL